uniref:Fucosyltransferase n=1 Tax=Parastrongyloides trichosuri TaxID=131310 RepID=A0A0N4Z7J1_PARTI
MRFEITRIFSLLTCIFITFYLLFSSFQKVHLTSEFNQSSFKKRVLIYTDFWEFEYNESWGQTGREDCEFTKDKSLFNSSHAVIFHFNDIKDIPKRAFPLQKFVYFTLEAPFSTQLRDPPKNYFNWIMSYNNQSDVLFEYGSKWVQTNDTKNKEKYDLEKILLSKKIRGITGLMSNCDTNSCRKIFVSKLSKYITTNVYGNCGTQLGRKTPVYVHDYNFEITLFEKYYFYFAIENAICENYITEKYWNRYTFDSVPIVMKRHIYTDVGIPNSSFIAIDDFKSAKDMGNYLNYLMDNPKEYLKYFEHRNQNIKVIEPEKYSQINGIGGLCSKLRTDQNDTKIIEDVAPIYSKINKCISKDEMINYANSW